MLKVPSLLHHLVQLTCRVLKLLVDAAHFLWLCRHSHAALAAENLFLRKQLTLYQERHVTPRRATNTTLCGQKTHISLFPCGYSVPSSGFSS